MCIYYIVFFFFLFVLPYAKINNRMQYVTFNGFKSRIYAAVSEVPQGLNLGPPLLLVFINDLDSVLNCGKICMRIM